jgi:hypothetical protein
VGAGKKPGPCPDAATAAALEKARAAMEAGRATSSPPSRQGDRGELPPSIVAALPGVPGIIPRCRSTVDPTLATPRANFDFYDRTGALIHTLFFDAVL